LPWPPRNSWAQGIFCSQFPVLSFQSRSQFYLWYWEVESGLARQALHLLSLASRPAWSQSYVAGMAGMCQTQLFLLSWNLKPPDLSLSCSCESVLRSWKHSYFGPCSGSNKVLMYTRQVLSPLSYIQPCP
jgi:hypothetical protein